MKQAEKFGRPIVTLSILLELIRCWSRRRGQGEANARNLMEMSIIAIIIGEGGSGTLSSRVANQFGC